MMTGPVITTALLPLVTPGLICRNTSPETRALTSSMTPSSRTLSGTKMRVFSFKAYDSVSTVQN